MIDIPTIMSNLLRSIPSMDLTIARFGYVLGIGMMIYAIMQFRGLSHKSSAAEVKGGFFSPVAYLLGGAAITWLPSSMGVIQTTLFGFDSPIAYLPSSADQFAALYATPAYVSSRILQMAGIVWFIRGCILIAHSSDPGVQHGKRGVMFVLGGIFACNYGITFNIIKSMLNSFVTTQHHLYPIQQTISSFL